MAKPEQILDFIPNKLLTGAAAGTSAAFLLGTRESTGHKKAAAAFGGCDGFLTRTLTTRRSTIS
jgi:hypothetical protein